MNLILSAICDEARERPDGRLDLAGIFDQLAAPGFPARQDRMTVVFVIEWDADEAGRQPLRADLVDEHAKKILTIQGHTDVAATRPGMAPPRTRLLMPLENVVFPHEGMYRFELVAGGTATDAATIFLREHAPPGEPGG